MPKQRTGLHVTRKIYTGSLKYMGLAIREEDILEAMSHTNSNKAAARYLGISYPTYRKHAKKYIDPITGKTLLELHNNMGGQGGSRPMNTRFQNHDLESLLKPGQICTEKRMRSLRSMLMSDGRLNYECACCGYKKRREFDKKMPLLLGFKDGDRSNWSIENINWICYNCTFDSGLDAFSDGVMLNLDAFNVLDEDMSNSARQNFYQLEDGEIDYLNVATALKQVSERAELEQSTKKEEDTKDDDSEMSLVSYLWDA
jgi:molybdenum-dependent DNA-binding transcriptional regulator ModE